MISVSDLTELKTSEEELRESEGRYRAVVEQATEGIVLFDVDSKLVLEANGPCQNLLDYTRSDTAVDALLSRSVLPGAFHKFCLPMRNHRGWPTRLEPAPFGATIRRPLVLGVARSCNIRLDMPFSLLVVSSRFRV
jgi:PAS domain-containing protein